MVACSCGLGSSGSATTSTSVRPGTAKEDLALLQTLTTELLASSGLEVEERIEMADMPCTGASLKVDQGRSATVTLSLKRPDGNVAENLGKVAVVLKQVNEKHFGGKGVLRDNSATPQESVMLMAEGFVISVNTTNGPERWSLDSSGPCRLPS
jgi:hypothetical protein